MSFKDAPLAFVDIETTGSNAQRDRITEIAIITWDHQTIKRWERLIDPGVGIPEFIQRLTGIGPDLLEGAPAFEDLAQELWQELEGKIFIAHNANFDYGFIKAAFKRLDMEFKAPVLCTVKLSRQLFTLQARHNLDSLIAAHGLTIHQRHRATPMCCGSSGRCVSATLAPMCSCNKLFNKLARLPCHPTSTRP